MIPVAELNHTAFFVLGLSLVAIALVVSFVGLRFDKFPSRAVLLGGSLAIALVVGATMVFAWRNAEDEQDVREADLAAHAAANEQSGNTTEADEEVGSAAASPTTSTTTAAATASADGAKLFATEGCTGCHTLADAGSTATTGPDLDAALKGKPTSFIKESIADPGAFVEQGYPPNVMPTSYGTSLTPEELDALVSYLSQVTSGQG